MRSFWEGRRVLITGHTGFKGSWLTLWLTQMGAEVTGLSLEPEHSFFADLDIEGAIHHRIGDIREFGIVAETIRHSDPEVIFHLAAQSLVRRGYIDPVSTWQTNVTGSVHIMQAARSLARVCGVVMVATDKVYANDGSARPFRETDPLGGHDPYSSSKAAMEIAVDSWRKSFLLDTGVRMASARAGNVIGGGDWADNRIVPDIARALTAGLPIEVRNPDSIRPWQHVLEPLRGYLTLAEKLLGSDDLAIQGPFNFGPDPNGVRTVRDVVTTALDVWGGSWRQTSTETAHHEADVLSLAIDKAASLLDHHPKWGFEKSVAMTTQWYKSVAEGSRPKEVSLQQLHEFAAS